MAHRCLIVLHKIPSAHFVSQYKFLSDTTSNAWNNYYFALATSFACSNPASKNKTFETLLPECGLFATF